MSKVCPGVQISQDRLVAKHEAMSVYLSCALLGMWSLVPDQCEPLQRTQTKSHASQQQGFPQAFGLKPL